MVALLTHIYQNTTKLANEKNVPFTIVQNKGTETPIGLVLSHSTAVDKEQIYVEDAIFKQE